MLRFLGCCPLVTEKNQTRHKFTFRCSPEIIASLAVTLMAFSFHIVYVTHTVFGYDSLLGPG